MKLTVSPTAHAWFMKELGVKEGQGVRFFGKYGGATNVHTALSTGMEPFTLPSEDPYATETVDDVIYFIEKTDDWFFDGLDLAIDYDQEKEEPIYFYLEH